MAKKAGATPTAKPERGGGKDLLPAFIEDKNGHVLPYLAFSGGSLSLSNEAIEQLTQAKVKRSVSS